MADDSFLETKLTAAAPGESLSGAVLSEISTALVQLYRRFYGRGPTRAKTVAGDDTITTVLADIFTTVEETLIDRGHVELVVGVRTAFQHAMRHEFIAAVERATERSVHSFTSGVDVDQGIATETFVLRPLEEEDEGSGRPDTSSRFNEAVRQADPNVRERVRKLAQETRGEASAVRAQGRQVAAHRRRRREQGPS